MKSRLIATGVLALSSVCALAQNINGAGATFPYPIYSRWFSEYSHVQPGVHINYQSIGSGGGIRQVSTGTVDFGGTDTPMNDKLLNNARNTLHTDILHFPVALGAVVPIHNIPGVNTQLNFTAAALAGIYLGTITRWNDPEIARANPGVNLPNKDIAIAHRSDASGTTFIWLDFLAKVSPAWRDRGPAPSINWPVGFGGKGNEGVAGFVRQTPYSIGYVELVYAVQTRMAYGQVQNTTGKFIKADLASVTAAATSAANTMPADFRVSIANAPGPAAYPIASFTWMLLPRDAKDRNKAAILKAFLAWGLTEGQKFAPGLSYAPLSKPVVDKELAAIQTLHY